MSTVCTTCREGYYLTDASQCAACALPNCKACASADKCSECARGFYSPDSAPGTVRALGHLSGAALQLLPHAHARDGTPADAVLPCPALARCLQCVACTLANCKTCAGDGVSCAQCQPLFTWVKEAGQCQACWQTGGQGCIKCLADGSGKCETCWARYAVNPGERSFECAGIAALPCRAAPRRAGTPTRRAVAPCRSRRQVRVVPGSLWRQVRHL